jgi:hypothetical protein
MKSKLMFVSIEHLLKLKAGTQKHVVFVDPSNLDAVDKPNYLAVYLDLESGYATAASSYSDFELDEMEEHYDHVVDLRFRD